MTAYPRSSPGQPLTYPPDPFGPPGPTSLVHVTPTSWSVDIIVRAASPWVTWQVIPEYTGLPRNPGRWFQTPLPSRSPERALTRARKYIARQERQYMVRGLPVDVRGLS